MQPIKRHLTENERVHIKKWYKLVRGIKARITCILSFYLSASNQNNYFKLQKCLYPMTSKKNVGPMAYVQIKNVNQDTEAGHLSAHIRYISNHS